MAHETYYEIARWRLDEQLEQFAALNSRLMSVFTAATALIALFVAFQDFDRASLTPAVVGLVAAAATVYVGLIAAAFAGFLVNRRALGADLGDLRRASMDDTSEPLQLWLADRICFDLATNTGLLQRKAQLTTFALGLWALDMLLLVAAALSAAI